MRECGISEHAMTSMLCGMLIIHTLYSYIPYSECWLFWTHQPTCDCKNVDVSHIHSLNVGEHVEISGGQESHMLPIIPIQHVKKSTFLNSNVANINVRYGTICPVEESTFQCFRNVEKKIHNIPANIPLRYVYISIMPPNNLNIRESMWTYARTKKSTFHKENVKDFNIPRNIPKVFGEQNVGCFLVRVTERFVYWCKLNVAL